MASRKSSPRRSKYRRNKRNKTGIILVSVVVCMILVVVGIKSTELKKTKEDYIAREEYYRGLIEKEELKAEELEEFEKYTQTKKYVEEIAKEKFGLVKDGEILFIAE